MQRCFNPNIPIFSPNSAEGLHFSAFHLTSRRENFGSVDYREKKRNVNVNTVEVQLKSWLNKYKSIDFTF